MLATISRALEERDQTPGHGARVAALAEPVARLLGWDDQRIAALRFGGALHDIGKVTVRAELLRKSGPLSMAELAEIRSHPTAGAALVAPLRSARHALPYVLFHHERWDGSGYPDGLGGEDIPLAGRIVAVADVFDTMTHDRSYRKALPRHQATGEILAQSGRQFDSRVADAFLRVVAELPAEVRSSAR
jgi:putative two-component system response regulator